MKLFLLAAFLASTSFASLYFKDPTIYYHDGQWYYFSQTRATQPQAESYCLHSGVNGGHLSSVTSKAENEWIYNTHAQFSNNEHSPLWFGGVRNLNGNLQKPFAWTFNDGVTTMDGVNADYNGCDRGVDCQWFAAKMIQRDEPNNLRGDEYCLAYTAPYLNQPATWKDDQCARAYKFVCKYDFGSWFTAPYTGVDFSAEAKYISAVASFNSSTYDYIYTSSDFGASWIKGNQEGAWAAVSVSSDGKYQTAADSAPGYLWISHDFGQSWAKSHSVQAAWFGVALSSSGEYQTAIDNNNGNIYYSLDFGLNWAIPDTSVTSHWYAIAVSADGRYQVASSVTNGAANALIATSSDWGDTWTTRQSSSGPAFYAAALSGDGKYQTVIDGQDAGGFIWISTNFGVSFASSGTQDVYSAVGVSASGKYQTVSVWNGGIYYSSDYGTTWGVSDAPNGQWYTITISSNGQYQVATDQSESIDGFVWLSSDWGHTWTHGSI